jgi:hypothetical protein
MRREENPMASDLFVTLRLFNAKRALLLRVPDGYVTILGDLPTGLVLETTAQGEYDFIQAFVILRSDLERDLPMILSAATFSSMIWICYPKAGHGIITDLNRDIVREVVEGTTSWRCVTQVAIDATWSALRLRPRELVGH